MKGRRKHKKPALDFEKSVSINKEILVSMMIEHKNRVSLRINLWMTLFARFVPSQYRSGHTNRILKLAERSMARMERTLDVKNVLQQNDDLQILLRQLFNSKQKWLFRHQRQRLLQAAGQSPDESQSDTARQTRMHGWEAKDQLDRSLLMGYFETNPVRKLKLNRPIKNNRAPKTQNAGSTAQ